MGGKVLLPRQHPDVPAFGTNPELHSLAVDMLDSLE